jgi:hypothetical protein
MMTPRTMIEFVSAEPFRPLGIHMASGRSFEVGHPEMIKVGRSSVTVYLRPDSDVEQPERWQEQSLVLLESVEPLDVKSSNGRG